MSVCTQVEAWVFRVCSRGLLYSDWRGICYGPQHQRLIVVVGSLLEIWSTQRLRPGDDRTLAPELWSVQVQLMSQIHLRETRGLFLNNQIHSSFFFLFPSDNYTMTIGLLWGTIQIKVSYIFSTGQLGGVGFALWLLRWLKVFFFGLFWA